MRKESFTSFTIHLAGRQVEVMGMKSTLRKDWARWKKKKSDPGHVA